MNLEEVSTIHQENECISSKRSQYLRRQNHVNESPLRRKMDLRLILEFTHDQIQSTQRQRVSSQTKHGLIHILSHPSEKVESRQWVSPQKHGPYFHHTDIIHQMDTTSHTTPHPISLYLPLIPLIHLCSADSVPKAPEHIASILSKDNHAAMDQNCYKHRRSGS